METDTNLFYQSLSSSVFEGLDPTTVGYQNAYALYEYALYAYTHNSSIYNSTAFSSNDLAQLFDLASQQQWEYNTPSNGSTVNAVAGRTLASKVMQQFMHTIDSNGVADKLTLMFGSYEPFLAFFALSGLATGPSGSQFNNLPLHGSTMTFELYSYPTSPPTGNLTQDFPPLSELWVRFLFRNGTASDEQLISYPLFSRGPSEVEMKWEDFALGMGAFSLNDVADWCTECNTVTLFCEAIESNSNTNTDPNSSTGSNKHPFNPVIGGVIGAVVTIALGIIAIAILMLFGFRLDYHPRNKGEAGGLGVLKRNGSGGQGGFKGAEKLASDTDLALKGAGGTVIRHERVGSWELNDGAKAEHSSLDKEVGLSRQGQVDENWGRRSEDDLGINPFGEPVKARESV
jgi:hypothetical protein